mmetsp:Transcript_10878/g.29146  ORF Transcript_10878/g.29146 Transcript_10878/m.29146 type:complete len:424 (-) Transcript_10878:670-1941(-)
MISSATRPPSATASWPSRNWREYNPVSRRVSDGAKNVRPPAPPRGTMVTLATWSYSAVSAPTMACPASWYAVSSLRLSEIETSFFAGPSMTRSSADSTSSISITFLPRRAAMIAASFIKFCSCAPEKPGARREICSTSTSAPSGLPRQCTLRISQRPLKSGRSTIMRRSKRPGRRSAWSSTSARLVAAITMMPLFFSNPSISTSIWLSVCSRSSFPPANPAPRCRPTASISSMKIMQGAFFFAFANRSRTRAAPTPTNISTNSEPEIEKNGTPASPATARASSVFPVPGGPSRITPRGIFAPIFVNRSDSFKNCTTSASSSFAWSQPATSLNVVFVSGTMFTRAPDLPRPIGPPGPPIPPGMPPPPALRESKNRPPKRIAGKISDCRNAAAPDSCWIGSTVTSTLCAVSSFRSSGSFGSCSSL